MKESCLALSLAGLLVLFALLAGCTSAPSASTAPGAAATTAQQGAPASPAGTAAPVVTTPTATVAPSGIDTTVAVHYNDFTCVNIPHTMGVEYLNPGEQYTVWVNTPGSGTIVPNLLVVDVNDNLKFSTSTPEWDGVQKTWLYAGITPLLKLIDITTPQSGTITIKKQGWYFLCIDDRKESGASSEVYQVPVKVTRI